MSPWKDLKEAQHRCGRNRLAMLLEALSLWPFGISLQDYLDQQLFLPRPGYAKRDFIGDRAGGWLDYHLNPRSDWALVDDKLTCQVLLEAAGLPTPGLLACYESPARPLVGLRTLSHPEQLHGFLAETGSGLFMKPVRSGQGQGCLAIRHYLPEQQCLLLENGGQMKLDELLQQLARQSYLFQERLKPHASLARLHPVLASLRVVVLQKPEQPKLFRCLLRLPTGKNMVDNFSNGVTGNLLASVDPASGTIEKVATGRGIQWRWLEEHPDNGQSLIGLTVPDWEEARRLAVLGSRLFPRLRLQHWDIGLTERGPVVLEVNVRGRMSGQQILDGRPIRDSDLKEALRGRVSRVHKLWFALCCRGS